MQRIYNLLIQKVTATSKFGKDSTTPYGDVAGRCKVRSFRYVRGKFATNPAQSVWFQQKPTGVTIAYFLYFWLVWLIILCAHVNIIKIKWSKLHQVREKAFRESQRKLLQDTHFISPIVIDQHYCTPILPVH